MPRGTKISVNRRERQEWLNRLESGEGITSIARKARRDIRTVKDNIEIATNERQKNEAEKELLVGIMRQHQEKLLREVDRLRQRVVSYRSVQIVLTEPEDEMLHEGLMEHLKRSPLRRMLKSFEDAVDDDLKFREQIRKRLAKEESDIEPALPSGIVTNPWTEAILDNLYSGLLDDGKSSLQYIKEKQSDGKYKVGYGSCILIRDTAMEFHLEAVINSHRNLISVAKQYISSIDERRQLLGDIAVPIKKELDTLIMKGYISGKCTYCPI